MENTVTVIICDYFVFHYFALFLQLYSYTAAHGGGHQKSLINNCCIRAKALNTAH